jgi:hypothetical protein
MAAPPLEGYLTSPDFIVGVVMYANLNDWAQWLISMDFISYDPGTAMFGLTGMGYNLVGHANDNYGPTGPWRNG